MHAEVKCSKDSLAEVIAAFLVYLVEITEKQTYFVSNDTSLSTVMRSLVAALSRLPVDMRTTRAADEFQQMVEAGERIKTSDLVEVENDSELEELLSHDNGDSAIIAVNYKFGRPVEAAGGPSIVSIETT